MCARLRALPILLTLFVFASCAGISLFGGAQDEFDRGLALFNQGRFEEAIPYFQRATAQEPNFAQAYLYLGRSYLSLSRWAEAISPLRTAYRLAPAETKGETLNFLIDALFGAAANDFKLGHFGSSIDLLKEILRLDPNVVKARVELVKSLLALGARLLAEGAIARAIEVYREAVQISPQNLDAYLGLANALFRSGDFLRALEAARGALRVDPYNREAQSLLNNLERR